MNPESYEQLETGYEEAIDAASDLKDALSELQESLVDSISDLHGDIQALICTLRVCIKYIHQETHSNQ